jgi:chemotaxis protein MotB
MVRISQWIGLAALSFSLTGCVAQEKYNALKLERDRMSGQLAQAQNEATAAKAEADILKNQLNALGGNANNRDALVNNLTQQNGDLEKRLAELNARYQEALGRVGVGSALPEPLSNELKQFADQNPDLVEFDAGRGIVKFKSDVTFSPGSADLTSKAKSVIDRFAKILNSPSASGYELMVAGHTDNTKVVNPETIKHGHLDNWYLSAHRAIAVSTELQHSNVNSQRLAVVGYADKRPVASNSTESGRAQNRRVEVLILPTTVRNSTVNNEKAAPRRATKGAGKQLNKDMGESDRPALNK